MNKKARMLTAIVTGFVVAMLIMTVAIFFGYTKAYGTGTETSVVRLVGLPIYRLTRSGSKYIGESNGIFMGIVCGICMGLSLVIEEIIGLIRKK